VPENLSSLEDVYTYSGQTDRLPPMNIVGRRAQVLELFGARRTQSSALEQREAEAAENRIRAEMSLLVADLRNGERPTSIVLSLIHENGQSVGSIAASTSRSVSEVDTAVGELENGGWVRREEDSGVDRIHLLLDAAE